MPTKPKGTRALAKTRLCVHYQGGLCKRGDACLFAHEAIELRVVPNLAGTKICPKLKSGECETQEDCPFAHNRDELRSTENLFKTSLCKFWDRGGCNLYQNCRFAHGIDELRVIEPSTPLQSKAPVLVTPDHPVKNTNEGYSFWSMSNSGRRLSAIAAQIQRGIRKNSVALDRMDESATQADDDSPQISRLPVS